MDNFSTFSALLEKVHAMAQRGQYTVALSVIADAERDLPNEFDKLLLLRNDIAVASGDQTAIAGAFAEIDRYVRTLPSNAARMAASLRLRQRLDDAWTLIRDIDASQKNLAAEAFVLGTAFAQSGRKENAKACFEFALTGNPGLLQARLNLGDLSLRERDFLRAAHQFEAATRLNASNENAWLGLGQCLLHTGRGRDALAAFAHVSGDIAHSALMLAWRGTAMAQSGEDENAAASYAQALARDPDCFDAILGLALVRERHGALDEAARRYEHAYRLRPASNLALGNLVYCLRRMAAWGEMIAFETELIARLERGDIGDYATQWMGIDVSVATFRRIAEHFIRTQSALHVVPSTRSFPPREPSRLRIGYLSSDFRNHATSRLLVEVLERHDRERFEIFAYALKPMDDSHVGRRIVAACEHFIDVSDLSATSITERMLEDRIDVLVDLNGHTKGACTGLAALRPAPVIANYLGYPGTMGDFVDYIIGDRFVTPAGSDDEFSEKIVRLPHSYQANDSKRDVGAATTRVANGLPENAIVACSFNQTWKFTPTIWAIWMRLLQSHSDLVLWLIDDNRWATENLRRAATTAGIATERLIFAPRIAHAEHLARLALADIALDPAPCTSHTTGSDALWMGVPLVTLVGRTFDARVGESLLHAVGLPELVTRSVREYESKLNELIGSRAVLSSLKTTLLERRRTSALFDSAVTARVLERAYTAMIERARSGAAPATIDIAQ